MPVTSRPPVSEASLRSRLSEWLPVYPTGGPKEKERNMCSLHVVPVLCCMQTDISEVVIKQMQQRHAQYSNMTYRVSDCRCMPEFMDCSFGHVLDKGGFCGGW